jgi:hypothetical protein
MYIQQMVEHKERRGEDRKKLPVYAKGQELPRMREHILKGVRIAEVANYVSSALAAQRS